MNRGKARGLSLTNLLSLLRVYANAEKKSYLHTHHQIKELNVAMFKRQLRPRMRKPKPRRKLMLPKPRKPRPS